MLVLSRKPNEKIVFPNLGITVQVIRVAGKAVRLGIDAPLDVRVLREEVSEYDTNDIPAPVHAQQKRHQLRNRLNTASLGLQLLHRKLEIGDIDDAESIIFNVFNELHKIDMELQRDKESQANSQSTHARRALIVEDNANESELLAAYLRMSGYEVDTVEDGLKAIAYLNKHERPDAVLLDMNMPRLDGPKTVTSIRCTPELDGLKLFAVSGANRQELGVEIGPSGVDRWFSKPVNANELVNEISRDLDDAFMSV